VLNLENFRFLTCLLQIGEFSILFYVVNARCTEHSRSICIRQIKKCKICKKRWFYVLRLFGVDSIIFLRFFGSGKMYFDFKALNISDFRLTHFPIRCNKFQLGSNTNHLAVFFLQLEIASLTDRRNSILLQNIANKSTLFPSRKKPISPPI